MNLDFLIAFVAVLWLLIGAWVIVAAIVEWIWPQDEFVHHTGRERLGK